MKGTTSTPRSQSSKCYELIGSPQQTILNLISSLNHVCLPPSLAMTWQRHSTEVKPMGLLCTQCCWPEVQGEARSLLFKSAKPSLYTSVSFLVSMEMFITVYPGTGQQQQQSQRSLLFAISADQMNHCCASSDHFCFITPCPFHYKNPALSKLICLFLVLTFLLIKCDFHRKTEILICPWGQLTSCYRLCPAQHFLGTSNHFIDDLKRPLLFIQFSTWHPDWLFHLSAKAKQF